MRSTPQASPHLHSARISHDWPFRVHRLPFFYGWVIWAFSTLGFLISIPGQTMGMAVFTDPFMAAFDLSRTQLSIAYLLGTIASSLLLTRAGRWYDRLGARTMLVASSLALGLVVLLISGIDQLARWLHGMSGITLATITFPLILLGYFGVRFSGQGVLTSASRNVLLQWFEERRGLVSGIRGIFVSLGFSLAPLFLALLIDRYGWHLALWILAGIVGLGFAALALIFIRDTPESCGLLPDGRKHASNARVTPLFTDHSLAEARQSPVFWIYSAGLAIHAMFGTAVTFHVVAIFEEAGRSREDAFAYFFPQAIVATSSNLLSSWLADHHRLKPFLVAMLLAFSCGAAGLLALDTTLGYVMLIAGFGIGGGLWGTLSNLANVRFFGRLHLGEISGLSSSLTVFASAIGPALFSIGTDVFGTYHAAEWLCLVGLLVLTGAAILIHQEDPLHPRTSGTADV